MSDNVHLNRFLKFLSHYNDKIEYIAFPKCIVIFFKSVSINSYLSR